TMSEHTASGALTATFPWIASSDSIWPQERPLAPRELQELREAEQRRMRRQSISQALGSRVFELVNEVAEANPEVDARLERYAQQHLVRDPDGGGEDQR